MSDLHPKAERILELYTCQNPVPTIREVQQELGYSSPAPVFYHLTKLREKGLLPPAKSQAQQRIEAQTDVLIETIDKAIEALIVKKRKLRNIKTND